MLNERLKTAREEKGLTRKKIAEILCVHDTTYGKYELGIREPSLELINEIARVLEVSAAYLIGETNNPISTNKEVPVNSTPEEKLRQYFIDKIGREPTPEELTRLDDFADTFIKGLQK